MTKILGVQQSLALNLHWILDRLKEPDLPSTETELPNTIHEGTDKIKSKRFGSLFLLMISCGVSSVFNSALRFSLNHPACVKHKVRKFRPDTEHEQEGCRQFYGCDSASVGFASLDFTSLGVVLILRWACNSSTMALRDFFLLCFYRRFLENRNLKKNQNRQKLKINDKTICEWVCLHKKTERWKTSW